MRAELISAIENMRTSESDVVTWAELKTMLTSAVNSFVVPSDILHNPMKESLEVVKYFNIQNEITIGNTSNQWVTVTPTLVTVSTPVPYQSFMTNKLPSGRPAEQVNIGHVYLTSESKPSTWTYLNVSGELHIQMPVGSLDSGNYLITRTIYDFISYIRDIEFNVASASYYYNMGGVGTGNLGAI